MVPGAATGEAVAVSTTREAVTGAGMGQVVEPAATKEILAATLTPLWLCSRLSLRWCRCTS